MLNHIIARLTKTVETAGIGIGSMTPSVYDTSIVLLFGPTIGNRSVVVQWLLAGQEGDGGWELPSDFIIPRIVSTMSASLALHSELKRGNSNQKINAALQKASIFLDRSLASCDNPENRHFNFVASELILPYLATLLKEFNINFKFSFLDSLRKKGEQKFQQIDPQSIQAATALVHTWEAWPNKNFFSHLQDGTGGVGHSPAATAQWYQYASEAKFPKYRLEHAKIYLQNATKSNTLSVEGCFTSAWPTNLMDRCFSLYPLILSGLIEKPYWKKIVLPHIEAILAAFQHNGNGIGFSHTFEVDGDTTGVALLLISYTFPELMRQELVKNSIDYFTRNDNLIRTYQAELDLSLGANAKFCQLLRKLNLPCLPLEKYILSMQESDGLWCVDKWNVSRKYATLCSLCALDPMAHQSYFQRAKKGLFEHQNFDGSWSFHSKPSIAETSYACLCLNRIKACGINNDDIQASLNKATNYLQQQFENSTTFDFPMWIEKTSYSIPHWDDIFHFSTLVSLLEQKNA